MSFGGIMVDVCSGSCRGVWFDWMELQKFDEADEAAGAELARASAGRKAPMRPLQIECPRCEGVKMSAHYFTPKAKVKVDECPRCGGIWLDAGELAAVRDEFKTVLEREAFVKEFVAAQSDQVFAEALEAERERTAANRKFASALRFLLPSKYLPGKQAWGAF